MKIIMTREEYKHFEFLMRQLKIPCKYLGCSPIDPTIQVRSDVVIDSIEQASEVCMSDIKCSIARKKALDVLASMPAGSLKKD